MRKFLYFISLAGMLAIAAPAYSQAVEIHVRPPKLKIEHRPARPERTMVWQRGYYSFDGTTNSYTWQPGQWIAPPRTRAVWVAPTYVHHGDHWIFVEGHWR